MYSSLHYILYLHILFVDSVKYIVLMKIQSYALYSHRDAAEENTRLHFVLFMVSCSHKERRLYIC